MFTATQECPLYGIHYNFRFVQGGRNISHMSLKDDQWEKHLNRCVADLMLTLDFNYHRHVCDSVCVCGFGGGGGGGGGLGGGGGGGGGDVDNFGMHVCGCVCVRVCIGCPLC